MTFRWRNNGEVTTEPRNSLDYFHYFLSIIATVGRFSQRAALDRSTFLRMSGHAYWGWIERWMGCVDPEFERENHREWWAWPKERSLKVSGGCSPENPSIEAKPECQIKRIFKMSKIDQNRSKSQNFEFLHQDHSCNFVDRSETPETYFCWILSTLRVELL